MAETLAPTQTASTHLTGKSGYVKKEALKAENLEGSEARPDARHSRESGPQKTALLENFTLAALRSTPGVASDSLQLNYQHASQRSS